MRTIHHVLDIDADPSAAWAALTSAEGLPGWWSRRVGIHGIYNFNWGYYLESLRLLLTTGTGRPYRPEHEELRA
jgi:hypothetical protein